MLQFILSSFVDRIRHFHQLFEYVLKSIDLSVDLGKDSTSKAENAE